MRNMINLKKYQGVGLVENLVALVLGLVMTASIIQLFLHGKMTYRLNQGMIQLQDNGRFISYYLPQIIRQAGFRSVPDATLYANFNAVFEADFITAENDTGINGSDILTIRYQGSGDGLGTADGKIRDCLQNPVDANQTTTNIFFINNNSDFVCRSIHTNPAMDQTGILVSDVENFQVLYGEDTNNDLSADRYVPADYPGLNMNNVASIRVGFLLQTAEEVSRVSNNADYNLLTLNYQAPADRRVRKVFSTTVYLRNRASQSAM